jgi:hypothetical protein
MTIRKKIGAFEVVANCAEEQHAQATSLLDKLAELNAKGPALKDGSVIRFGWSDLKLLQQENELIVSEPDFKKDPFREFLPQVTETLGVLSVQTQLLSKAKVDGIDSLYSSRVIMDKGCLGEREVYLERTEPADETDSGWFIGTTDNGDVERSTENLEAIYVFQVFQIRPALLNVMAFPPGYLAVFDGDEIQAVVNSQNQNVLLRK